MLDSKKLDVQRSSRFSREHVKVYSDYLLKLVNHLVGSSFSSCKNLARKLSVDWDVAKKQSDAVKASLPSRGSLESMHLLPTVWSDIYEEEAWATTDKTLLDAKHDYFALVTRNERAVRHFQKNELGSKISRWSEPACTEKIAALASKSDPYAYWQRLKSYATEFAEQYGDRVRPLESELASRASIVEWMFGVCESLRFSISTFALAVLIFDRYAFTLSETGRTLQTPINSTLSTDKLAELSGHDLALISVSAILLAGALRETWTNIDTDSFLSNLLTTGEGLRGVLAVDEIIYCQVDILRVIEGNLLGSMFTLFDFFSLYMSNLVTQCLLKLIPGNEGQLARGLGFGLDSRSFCLLGEDHLVKKLRFEETFCVIRLRILWFYLDANGQLNFLRKVCNYIGRRMTANGLTCSVPSSRLAAVIFLYLIEDFFRPITEDEQTLNVEPDGSRTQNKRPTWDSAANDQDRTNPRRRRMSATDCSEHTTFLGTHERLPNRPTPPKPILQPGVTRPNRRSSVTPVDRDHLWPPPGETPTPSEMAELQHITFARFISQFVLNLNYDLDLFFWKKLSWDSVDRTFRRAILTNATLRCLYKLWRHCGQEFLKWEKLQVNFVKTNFKQLTKQIMVAFAKTLKPRELQSVAAGIKRPRHIDTNLPSPDNLHANCPQKIPRRSPLPHNRAFAATIRDLKYKFSCETQRTRLVHK